MRKAVIENDTLVNIIICDAEYEDHKGRELIDADGLSIGMVRAGGEWQRPTTEETAE